MTVPLRDRFMDAVDTSGECWLWTRSKDPGGYGHISLPGSKVARAHRFVYEQLVGPIPEGLTLDHLCRTPSCVRPDHLEPVTRAENNARGFGACAVNARKTHCKRGHEFTPENTIVDVLGKRKCRECKRARDRSAAAKLSLGVSRHSIARGAEGTSYAEGLAALRRIYAAKSSAPAAPIRPPQGRAS